VTNFPSTLLTTIHTLFPEGVHPDPSVVSPHIYSYITQDNTNFTISFVMTGAGYTNRLGFAKYDPVNHVTYATTVQYSFPTINNVNGGCLQYGDTYKFGPFFNNDMIIMFLDSNSNSANRFWTYLDPPYFNNPDTTQCACTTGFTHGSWVYLTQEDMVIFGVEDLSLGDADYNDVMFYLSFEGGALFNNVPPYSNGTIQVCNSNTAVTTNSYAELNCTQWGLLESAVATQWCLTYMSIPSGWTWARDDDPAAHAAITQLGTTQWGYTAATCFLLSSTNMTGVGYTPTGAVCSPSSYSIKTIVNTTTGAICYNSACTSRFVLRGADLGAGCTSAGVCSKSNRGNILTTTPVASTGVVDFPSLYSVYLETLTGQLSLSTSIQIPTGKQQIDVFVLLDLTTSTSTINSGVATSFSNLPSAFAGYGVDAKIGLAVYAPNSASPYYMLDSDYTLSSDNTVVSGWATNKIASATAATSCPSSGYRPMYKAMAYVLDAARGINWRPDAFHIIWVVSACPFDTTTEMHTAVINTGIMPVFALATSNGYPSGWDITQTSTYAAPYSTRYKAGATRSYYSDVFRSIADQYNNPIGGPSLLSTYWSIAFPYVVSDPQGFITNLPTTVGHVPSSLIYNVNYALTWPSALAVDQTVTSYSAVLRLIGRQTTSFSINFNHNPILSSVTLPINAGVNRTINFSPTDPDGNVMALVVVSLPTLGVLYRPDTGAAITAAGTTLPYGMYSLIYGANAQSAGSDTWNMGVRDGCAISYANATMIIAFTNTPPHAKDFTITMLEDSTATGTNGLIDFAPQISDVDNPLMSQTLQVYMSSLPAPTTYGSITTWSSSGAGTVITTLGAVANQTRFVLNIPSGFGLATFTYKVNDGFADSNTATVTINITHVNHPPVLNIPVTQFTVNSLATADSAISASITDPDGSIDVVNLYAVWSNVTTFTVKTTDQTLSGSPSDASPFAMYNASYGPSSGTNFPVPGLAWNRNSAIQTQAVTFQARDRAGAKSNNVTVYFSVTALSPPTWTLRPQDAHPSGFTITQGSTLTLLDFAATDADAGDYQSLVFTLQSNAANGDVRLISQTNPANYISLSAGQDFSNPSNTATYVPLNSTAVTSFYRITYAPVSTFSFVVRDITGLYASQSATVIVNVLRVDTPPESSDSALQGNEQAVVTTSIPLFSTNNISNPVLLQMLTSNFGGLISLDSTFATTWTPGFNTTLTNTGFLPVYAKGWIGIFSPSPTVPIGNFTYRVIEPGTPDNNVGPTYTCQIYLNHVNHPPASQNVAYTVKKRDVLQIVLPATDPDADDTPPTITALLKSIVPGSKGIFYADAGLTQVIDGTFIANGGSLGTARTMYYQSMTDFSLNNLPLARFTFVVVDQHGLPSDSTYSGSITVLPAGDPPVFGGSLDATTYQETPVPMVLNVAVTTETGAAAIATLQTLPTRGSLFACDDASVCTLVSASQLPFVLPSTNGRVVFSPRAFDWDQNFTTFNFTLTDSSSGAVAPYVMNIHVIHVNKRPFIEASNFLTTAQTTSGIIVNESTTHTFSWKAYDQDSLPSTLQTELRVSFYTTQGFSVYSCTGTAANWLNDLDCTYDPAVPFAIRSDFSKNAKKLISSYSTVSTSCPDFNTLKLKYGVIDTNCESHFKMVFAPTPGSSYTPYVAITFNAVDDYSAESTAISALIYVKALNQPPTISSPPLVLAANGISNPFIRNTDQSSASFNSPVVVGDVDAFGNAELLTISVNSGFSGVLTWPATAPCWVDPSNSQLWYCKDTIPSFNQWLGDMRFQVNSGNQADLTFTINDLGFSSDWKPSPNLTASSMTSIKLTAAITAPKGNSSTLAIAVGVAAAAGLLLLGALGFFLRRAVAPPKDDYFSAAVTPLSAAPQSPLYQAQNTTHENVLYKAKA